MEAVKENTQTLGELREQKTSFLKRFLSFFTNWRSLFYYALIMILVGVLWVIYSLVTNSGTQLYGWDYKSQFIPAATYFWDCWHHFFKTFSFPNYTTSTFLGGDNIGSNSYYSLFDPFLAICYIFPRAWVPQTFVIATIGKGVVAAFAMRAYLRYMGVSEWSARLGGLIFAYSGFTCFFEGFPTALSMTTSLPFILLGIETVLKEKKITYLVIGLYICGLTSFFYLVVFCFFGVAYAGWRWAWTIKKRNWKDNIYVILFGILGFALGIAMCAFTLIPSLRQSGLSGRTDSIGRSYLHALIQAFKSFDIKRAFKLLFETVGGNPGRELMGLISFFYPTCNYLYLPLAYGQNAANNYSYDAWTSSIFCYTPMVILFITGMINAARKKNWCYISGFAICCYLLFTNFAYYAFYAFAGDGYGRWFIVLLPAIIYIGCKQLDELKDDPKWVLPTGTIVALVLTILTFFICKWVLDGKTFENDGETHYTYWKTHYQVPGVVYYFADGRSVSLIWIVFYQIALVVVEGIVINIAKFKAFLPHILMIFATAEIAVAGNISFIYGSSASYTETYLDGIKNGPLTQDAFDKINDGDHDYFRSYNDGANNNIGNNGGWSFNYNGTSCFHSLYNFDVTSFCLYSGFKDNGGTVLAYGEEINSPRWSGYYGNKRFALDQTLGMRYYVIKGEGYGGGYDEFQANVPFGSVEVYRNSRYRVYRSAYTSPEEGSYFAHAVDNIYPRLEDKGNKTPNLDQFYKGTTNSSSAYDGYSYWVSMLRNEETYLNGGIIQDDDVETIKSEGLTITEDAPEVGSWINTSYKEISFAKKVVKTYHDGTHDYGYYGSDRDGNSMAPGSFLSNLGNDAVVTYVGEYGGETLKADFDKLCLYPAGKVFGNSYFNEDKGGAYFLMHMDINGGTTLPRIYFLGDKFDADGNLVEENAVLSYEYGALANWKSNYVTDYSDVFGFYAYGKVKAIVLLPKGSIQYSPMAPNKIYMATKTELDSRVATLRDNSPTEVKYSTDKFTFKTSFADKKLMVTTLAYDAGWQGTYKDGNGSHKMTVVKLDGGLVGFIAPAGEISYVLEYKTPYSTLTTILHIIGLVGTGITIGTPFVIRAIKKRKKNAGEAASI